VGPWVVHDDPVRSRPVLARDPAAGSAAGSAAWSAAWPAAWLGVGAGLLNVNFLFEWVLPHHSPVAVTVVSDLAASGQPWNWAFRVGDALSAGLLLALCWLALTSRTRARTLAWRAATVLLVAFAASTLLAVVFPEHCTVAAGRECREATSGGWDVVHDTISTIGTSAGVLAAAVFAWATRRRRALARLHLLAFVLAGGLGLVFVTAQAGSRTELLGWTQRGQIAVLSAWYVVVGVSVALRRTSPSSAGRRPDKIGS
jgi:hypothetical protein